MEQMLDLPVKSEPLVHVTKSRIKNNSRKHSVPSRSHLKRNLVSTPLLDQNKDHSPEVMMGQRKVPTKLPPPPVPKKPKINLNSMQAASSNILPNDRAQESKTSSIVDSTTRSKPAIAPKPLLPTKPDIALKSVNGRPTSLEFNPKQSNDNGGSAQVTAEKISSKQQKTELNSPSKASLSFSERLKASSLSRRKDANTSNGKGRSHIISPVRRGSRTFMNTDSISESNDDTDIKSSIPSFRRYSSQTSLKSDEGSLQTIDGLLETDLDLDDFQNLSISPVCPLPVNSVLSSGNSFEEEESLSKDSFDTRELNILAENEQKPENLLQNDNLNMNGLVVDTDGGFKSLTTNDSKFLEELQHEEYLDFDPNKNGDIVTSERLPMSEKSGRPKGDIFPPLGKTDENNRPAIKENTKSINETRKGSYKDGSNTNNLHDIPQRDQHSFAVKKESEYDLKNEENNNQVSFNKTKLIGSTGESRGHESTKKAVYQKGDQKSAQLHLSDTESTLENVTQDIDSNFSFEILSKAAEKEVSGGLTSTVFSTTDGPPGFLQNQMQNFMDVDTTITSSIKDSQEKKFQYDDAFAGVVEMPFTEDGNFPLHSVPNFDVDMLPIVPPPPMDEDDENIFSSIIDPPTVYGDSSDDDDMDICPPPPAAPVPTDSEMATQDFDANLPSKHFDSFHSTFGFSEQQQTSEGFENEIEQGFDETDLIVDAKKARPISDFLEKKSSFEIAESKPKQKIEVSDKESDKSKINFLTESNDTYDKIGARQSVLSLAHRFETSASEGTESVSRKQKRNEEDREGPENLYHAVDSKHKYKSSSRHSIETENIESNKKEMDQSINVLGSAENSKSIVLEENIKPPEERMFDVESMPLHLLDSYQDQLNADEVKESLDYREMISEKGKQRKKSFSERNTPANIAKSAFDEENDGRIDERIVIQPLKLGALDVREGDVCSEPPYSIVNKSLPERKLSNCSSEKNITAEYAPIGISDIPVLNETDDLPGNVSQSKNAKLSQHAFLKSQEAKTSSSDELLGPAESNKLSPWSSVECLPDSGKPSSRKSSVSSSIRSGPENLFVPRKWSSFCSSSGDEQDDDKKVNIVQLMRERTLTHSSDAAEDFLGNTEAAVELDFSVPLTSDKDENASEIDSSEDLIEDAFDSRINNIPLDQWTTEDVGDWLEMIGLVELRAQFEERKIGGPELLSIDLHLLDEMGITNLEDRELVLSEIYSLKNPEDMDVEMSLLDALDNASGYDREKMLAILEALRMSTEDQENKYLPSPSPKLSGGGRKKSEKSTKGKENYRRAVSEYSPSTEKDGVANERSKSVSPSRKKHNIRGASVDSSPSVGGKEKKGLKKKSFLKGAFSFRRNGSGRLARLFSSRKKLVDSSLKYLLQSSPQGVVKIWTYAVEAGSGSKAEDSSAVSLLVTSSTTAKDVTKTLLEKLDMIEDANCFYLVQSHSSKSVPEVVLNEDDCPLVLQCRWPDAERYKFELKKKSEGSVIIVHSDENLNDERSVKIETTMKTTCAEIIAISLKKLQNHDPVKCFSLYPMKNQKQGISEGTQESQIPMEANLLKIASSLSRPAVYKLVRVNFLGSPEKSLKQDDGQRERIERLQNELKEKREELFKARKTNQSFEKRLKEVVSQNEILEKKVDEQNTRITELHGAEETLRSQVGDGSNGQSQSKEYQQEIATLSDKLNEKEREKKVLKEIIENLKTSLEETQNQARELEKLQEMGLMQNDYENSAMDKLKDVEKENQLLKGRIVQIENESLENKIELAEYENRLEEENKRLNSMISELRQEIDSRDVRIASLRNAQKEKEVLAEKVQNLQMSINKKNEKLNEMSQFAKSNEELLDKISALEREVKQKDRLMSDASIVQRKLMELQRKFDSASEELIEKKEEVKKLIKDNADMRKEFSSDIEAKNETVDRLDFDNNDLRRNFMEADEERKLLKSKVKELEMYLHEKERAMEDVDDLQHQLKEEQQKAQRLEKEMALRADEFSAVCKEKDSSNEGLRDHIESLEQSFIEKDSRILDLEFKLQKIERSLRETENVADDEAREKSRLALAFEDATQKVAELDKRVTDYKRLVAEKDKIIQNIKGSQTKADETIKRELNNAQRSLQEKETIIDKMRAKADEERIEMKSRFETLQGLVTVKETKWKEKEARFINEREEQRSRTVQLEEKLVEKESSARKLEAKVSKLEKVARENMKKFEKFMSDKDRMLRQVREESEKDVMDLKEKIRQMDDALKSKDKSLPLSRSSSVGKEFEIKLKQKEEENKQHKYLLERLMSVVNDKDPRILEEFENSFGGSSNEKSDAVECVRTAPLTTFSELKCSISLVKAPGLC
eukprot:gene15110-6291_t